MLVTPGSIITQFTRSLSHGRDVHLLKSSIGPVPLRVNVPFWVNVHVTFSPQVPSPIISDVSSAPCSAAVRLSSVVSSDSDSPESSSFCIFSSGYSLSSVSSESSALSWKAPSSSVKISSDPEISSSSEVSSSQGADVSASLFSVTSTAAPTGIGTAKETVNNPANTIFLFFIASSFS